MGFFGLCSGAKRRSWRNQSPSYTTLYRLGDHLKRSLAVAAMLNEKLETTLEPSA